MISRLAAQAERNVPDSSRCQSSLPQASARRFHLGPPPWRVLWKTNTNNRTVPTTTSQITRSTISRARREAGVPRRYASACSGVTFGVLPGGLCSGISGPIEAEDHGSHGLRPTGRSGLDHLVTA